MGKLTSLQRLGISSLLLNFRYHGNNRFNDGHITFKHNEHGKYVNMFVDTTGSRNYRLEFTLNENENIDDNFEYNVHYDYENDVYRIIDINVWGDVDA